MSTAKLILSADGIWIQGPDHAMVNMLLEAGAKIRRAPRKFPIREGMQLICVEDRIWYDAAMWVHDDTDCGRCRTMHDDRPALITWLEIKNEALFTATREPWEKVIADHDRPRADATTTIID